MENMIKAIETVRNFSELLNNIKFKGHRYTIPRGGNPIALIGPIKSYPEKLLLKDLKELLKAIPSLGEAFAKDLDEIIQLTKLAWWESMGVIFDTSALIALERNLIDIDKLIADKGDEPFSISVITASELLHGNLTKQSQ